MGITTRRGGGSSIPHMRACMCVMLLLEVLHIGRQSPGVSFTTPGRRRNTRPIFFLSHPTITISTNNHITLFSLLRTIVRSDMLTIMYNRFQHQAVFLRLFEVK